jgi:methionyl-tRNA formyltransferase
MVTPDPAGLRVIFFGTPDFAVPTLQALLRSAHDVVAVVAQPDRPKGRGQQVAAPPVKVVAAAAGIPVLQPTRLRPPEFLETVRALETDIGVVAAYGRLLPDDLLALPRLGMINVHASLLPRYRGASPIHHAVMAGDAITGVTIMRVASELDAGPMLATVEVPIGPDETTGDVEPRLAAAGADLLADVVDRLARGPVEEIPQDHSRATFAPRLEKSIGRIDWTQPAAEVHNRVRGLQPWPGTWTSLEGARLAIRRTSLPGEPHLVEAPPGTIVSLPGGERGVACGDGRIVALREVQPDGRRVMAARDFFAGRRLPTGTTFDPAP